GRLKLWGNVSAGAGRQGRRGEDPVRVETRLGHAEPWGVLAVDACDLIRVAGSEQARVAAGQRTWCQRGGDGVSPCPVPGSVGVVRLPRRDDLQGEVPAPDTERRCVQGNTFGSAVAVADRDDR